MMSSNRDIGNPGSTSIPLSHQRKHSTEEEPIRAGGGRDTCPQWVGTVRRHFVGDPCVIG